MPNLEPDQKKKITKNHMKNVPHRWSGSGSRDIEGQSVVTQPRRCGARPGFQRPGKRLGSRRARSYLHQLKRRDLCIGRDSGFRRYRHRILFSLPAIIAVAVVSTLQASGPFTATGFKPSTYYNLGLCFGTRTGTTAGCPDNAPVGLVSRQTVALFHRHVAITGSLVSRLMVQAITVMRVCPVMRLIRVGNFVTVTATVREW